VSTTSLLVRPRWSHRPSGPTVSATCETKATTSWSVVRSISAIRSTFTAARASIAASAGAGTVPRRACARQTASSTSSIRPNRASSVQTAPISGRV
jgi:hypothetical protein